MAKAREAASTILAAVSGSIGLDWGSKPSRRIAATAFALMLVVWLVAVAAIWRSHNLAVQAATINSQSFAVMATSFTSKSIEAADLILKSMLDWVAEEDIETVDQFETIFGERRYFDKLRDRIANVDLVDVATYIAPSGRVITFTRSYPPPPINLADRDYFKEQSVSGAPPRSLGNVVKNRGSGRWTFYLSRQIRSRSGEIIGVGIVGIESAYLAELYRRIAPGKNVIVRFMRNDGTLLATSSTQPEVLGKQFRELPSMKILGKHPEGGTEYMTAIRVISETAERARVLTVRPIPNLPGYVTAVVGMDVSLDPWRNDREATLFIVALLTLAIGFASRQSQKARRETDRRRTDELEQKILLAIDALPLALTAVLDGNGRVLRSNSSFDRFFRYSGRPGGLRVGDIPEAEAITRFIHVDGGMAEAEVRFANLSDDRQQRIARFTMTKQNLQGLGQCSIVVGIDETAQRAA